MATDNKINVVIDAKNNTKRPINEVENSLSSLSGTVKKFAAAAGVAFAAKQVFDFGASAVKAFAESEAALAKVTATLATLPSNLKVTTTEVEKLAASATKLGFSNEEAAINIANFTQRTGDLKKAVELNALAMDLARAKNLDLASAGNVVNLVLSGNARALKQFGIELDETKSPMEALVELQGKVAGQAAAFADTTQGKLTVLSESWGEFKEAVGASIAEGLTPFLNEMIRIVSDPQFIAFFTMMSQVVGGTLLIAFKSIQTAIAYLTDLFFRMFLGIELISNFIKDTFSVVLNGIKSVIEEVTSVVMNLVNALNRAVSLASSIGSSVGGAVKSAASKITGKRAEGGPVQSGSSFLVGERGPELFTPRFSGNIMPNHALAGIGGGGITINISGNTLLDSSAGEKMAEQIMRTLRRNLKI